MRVNSLVHKNNIVFINLDNGDKLRVHYEVALKSALRKNDELTEMKKAELLELEEEFTLKNSALRYLSIRPHSSFELRTKLIKKGYPKEKISAVIDDLNSKNYLSDYDFAVRFAEENIKKKKGVMKVRAELMKKGVNREIIDEILYNFGDSAEVLNNAYDLAKKKYKLLAGKELPKFKMKQKLYSFLGNKGYTNDIIRKVVDDIISDDEY